LINIQAGNKNLKRILNNVCSMASTLSPTLSREAGEGAKPVKLIAAFFIVLSITACSPKYDWRDVQGGEAPYTVLMPDKPSRLSREIQLGQQTVTMHMAAAKIDDVKFVVGAVKMLDATEAQTALAIIKNTLLKNMAGTITQEKRTVTNAGGKLTINDKFSAVSSASSIRMSARLVASDVWAFEVLVVGPEVMKSEAVDTAIETFLSSFKPV